MTALTDRLLDVISPGSYCFPALMKILDVVETDQVPTAAVECRAEPRLLINPEFAAKHADTPRKLTFLLMHELHHVIFGHTRLFPRSTRLENLAFDIMINATLCRQLPDPADHALVVDLYPPDILPHALLRPIAGWRSPHDEELTTDPKRLALRKTARALKQSRGIEPKADFSGISVPWALDATPELVRIYVRLYWGDGCSYSEVLDALRRWFQSKRGELAVCDLLGDHGDEEAGASSAGVVEGRSSALFDTVREIVASWPAPPNPTLGQSWGGALASRVTPPVRGPRDQLRSAILAVADRGTVVQGRTFTHREARVDVAYPRANRTAIVQRAFGHRPLLYTDTLPVLRCREGIEPVHVYVDVSGSIGDIAGPLFGAILDAGSRVHPLVHQFSTEVHDVTLAELRAGVCKTTGGTAIECVAAHMVAHKIRRALIITDGYVGTPGTVGDAWFRRSRLAVAYTPTHTTRDLAPYGRHVTHLNI